MTTVTAESAAPSGRLTQLASSRSCSARASPVSQQAVTARKSTIPAARRRPLGGSGDEGDLSTNDPAEYLRHAEDKEGPHLRAFLRSSGPGSVTVERPEVVPADLPRDLLADHGALLVGGAEVDAAPDPRLDDLVEGVREAVERPRRDRHPVEGPARDEGDLLLVVAEELGHRRQHRPADAAVTRWVVGKRRRGEGRSRRGLRREQRLPVRVGDRLRVAVGVRLADRRSRSPEVPEVLVVP